METGKGEGVEHLAQQETQLPEHNCKNCGACCGQVIATKAEIVAIKQYVLRINRKEVKRLKRQPIGMTKERQMIQEIIPRRRVDE